ncbi:MAG: YbaN family protein [Promethearchaeota archaeon]
MTEKESRIPEQKNNEPENLNQDDKKIRKKVVKGLYFIAGIICLGLGIIGIFLPILPTTPFLLLAAACFARSSERFYNWLLNNRILGSYIRSYKEGKGMPKKVKIFTISMLWITILLTTFVFIQIIWIRYILIIIAIAVTIHIILIRPKIKENYKDVTKQNEN